MIVELPSTAGSQYAVDKADGAAHYPQRAHHSTGLRTDSYEHGARSCCKQIIFEYMHISVAFSNIQQVNENFMVTSCNLQPY